jgi:hypothetical protein
MTQGITLFLMLGKCKQKPDLEKVEILKNKLEQLVANHAYSDCTVVSV